MYAQNRIEIQEAIEAADDAILHLESAREYLGSAGRWGLLDLFGGGFISGIVKQSKMGDAEREIPDMLQSCFVGNMIKMPSHILLKTMTY